MKRSILLPLVLLALATANAAVTGRVINRTTGQPAAGVPVTLIKMQISMDPVDEVFTNKAGEFSFDDDMLDASGQRTVGMLRAEHQSVNYSHLLPPMAPTQGVEIDVYDSLAELPQPSGRILVLEPGPDEVVVNEYFEFTNNQTPPVTFRDAQAGALQFYLPADAQGNVEVQGKGPAGMPLNASAEPAQEAGVYKVDFPIKPGRNSIALTYATARPPEGEPLQLPSRYPSVRTRIAIPQGVEVSGGDLTSLGVEPQSQMQIFDVPQSADISLLLTGAVATSRAIAETAGGGSPNQISVQNAPIAAELWWILAIVLGILGVGFYNLNTSKA